MYGTGTAIVFENKLIYNLICAHLRWGDEIELNISIDIISKTPFASSLMYLFSLVSLLYNAFFINCKIICVEYNHFLNFYISWHLPLLFSSLAQLCPTLCDPMDCITPSFPVHHQFPKLAQTHVHRFDDAIQPSHPLLSSAPSAFNFLPASRAYF